MLGSAQRVGNLAWALREMAESNERRLGYRLQFWLQLLFPMLLICLGAVVFVLVVAYFCPLVSLIEALVRMKTRGLDHRPRRRGYTLLELAVAVFLLMAAMGVTVKVLGWIGAERRSADRRQWAVQAVSNILGAPRRRAVRGRHGGPVKAIAAASRTSPGCSRVRRGRSPSTRTKESPVPSKRVRIELRWTERGRQSGGARTPDLLGLRTEETFVTTAEAARTAGDSR